MADQYKPNDASDFRLIPTHLKETFLRKMKTEFKTISNVELKLPNSSQIVSYSEEFGAKSADALKESLSAMSEVRNELKEVYSDNSGLQITVEKLSTAIESYKKAEQVSSKKIEELSSELKQYKKKWELL